MYYVDPLPGPDHTHDSLAVAVDAAQFLADTTGVTFWVRGNGVNLPVAPR